MLVYVPFSFSDLLVGSFMSHKIRLIREHFCGWAPQGAKEVVSDSPGLVDFAVRLVIFVLNLPDGQVLLFWGNSNYRRIVINPASKKGFGG